MKHINLNHIDLAYKIAKVAHHDQVDKGGMDYMNHIYYVSSHFTDPSYKIAAILHDVLEDSQIFNYTQLTEIFGNRIASAVLCLTKNNSQTHNQYLQAVKSNEIAKAVKLKDIEHNLCKERWKEMPDWYENKLKEAEKFLLS